MMHMSTKGRYGLRLMVSLASRYGDGPVSVEQISEEQQISSNYIHVLMGALKNAGLVRSLRGAHGGYEMTRPPEEITALEVIQALEGDTSPVNCVADKNQCQRSSICPTRNLWCEIASKVETVLGGYSLKTLASSGQRDPGTSA